MLQSNIWDRSWRFIEVGSKPIQVFLTCSWRVNLGSTPKRSLQRYTLSVIGSTIASKAISLSSSLSGYAKGS